MNTDITFCANNYKCLLRNSCRRAKFPTKKENSYNSYTNFYNSNKETKCEYFYEMKGEDK